MVLIHQTTAVPLFFKSFSIFCSAIYIVLILIFQVRWKSFLYMGLNDGIFHPGVRAGKGSGYVCEQHDQVLLPIRTSCPSLLNLVWYLGNSKNLEHTSPELWIKANQIPHLCLCILRWNHAFKYFNSINICFLALQSTLVSEGCLQLRGTWNLSTNPIWKSEVRQMG